MKPQYTKQACVAVSLLIFGCTAGDRPSELVQPARWWEQQPRPVYASLEKVGTFQDWFEVYKLNEDTYALYEPNLFEEVISYLVLGNERGIIIDTGTGIGNIRQVVTELTSLPVSVVNTHSHYDHIGGNHLFDEIAIYGGAIPINRITEGIDNASLQRHVTGELVHGTLPEGFNPQTWNIPSTEPTYLPDDGTTIDLGGRMLEVIYTPGHSSGSICLLDRENRLLFTGDTFYPGPLYAHTPEVDIADYRASIDKLFARSDEYDFLCPGHNEPWVKSEVIPRVGTAFDEILAGQGTYDEDGDLRRYYFDGFDILIRADMIRE